MSPEQAPGERELDGMVDQYALGCVLYEMLAGHPPFTGAQIEAVIRQHPADEPTPVTQVRPSVPEELVTVVKRVLAKSPADRFRTTGEMAAALGGIDFLLEGSARIAGNVMRIKVQLIDCATDEHLWSETYDGSYSVEESIGVQTDIAQKIATALAVEITPEESTHVSALPTENQEAYDLYLRGMDFWGRTGDYRDDLAFAQRFWSLSVVEIHWATDPIRSDPRFQALLEKYRDEGGALGRGARPHPNLKRISGEADAGSSLRMRTSAGSRDGSEGSRADPGGRSRGSP